MLNGFMEWIKDHQRDENMGGRYGMTRREFKELSPYMQNFVQRDTFAGGSSEKPEAAISQIVRGKDGLPVMGKQNNKPQKFTPIQANGDGDSNGFLDMLKRLVNLK